jgi:hypothetical protein
MVCVAHVSTTIPKGGKIPKASNSSFFFLTKIGSLVNFIVRNVFMEVDKYEKEVECKYIYI